MTAALAGIRVLDLTRYIPGPYCTLLLGALGADVIKVEEPPLGDPTRAVPPAQGDDSALHAALNEGKRSIAVDLRQAGGAAVVRRLALRADVLVEAFRPGVLARRGLGAEELTAENPRLVYCSVSGYGQTGPLAARAGHDVTYLARGGFLATNRDREGTPVLPSTQAVLAALQARERTGRGQVVDVSLLAGVQALMALPAARVAAGGSLANELTGTHACYNVYRCRDGRFLAVGALEPKFWEALCRTLDEPELVGRQWAAGPRQREMIETLVRTFAARDRDEWMRVFAGVDACVEPVLELPEAQAQPGAGAPLRLSATPVTGRRPAPRVSQDAVAILDEAGYAAEEIVALRESGVVA
jgi:crotonobetainyl-CoA:carnitine CoA-transferase CaiB-like acyl-CoA transferase